MSHHRIHHFLTLLLLFFLVSLNGCGPDVPEQILPTQIPPQCPTTQPDPAAVKQTPLADPEIPADSKVLRVGISPDAPPYIYKKDKEIKGLEADLAEQLGKFSGKTVQFVNVTDDRAREALLKNHIDIIMSGRKIVKNSSCPVMFSDPYLRAGQILLVRTPEVPLFSSGIYNLEYSGHTFGVILGSEGDQFLTRSIRGIRIMRFKTVPAAIQALKRKKIDLFLHDAPTICSYAGTSDASGLTPILSLVTEEYIGWEIRKEDEDLRQHANAFIKQRKADGQLQKTLKQWIPNL